MGNALRQGDGRVSDGLHKHCSRILQGLVAVGERLLPREPAHPAVVRTLERIFRAARQQGIAAAVTRRTLDRKNPDGWVPEQKITVEEAVRAYTAGSARAEFAEQSKGALQPGMLADMVILSQDLFKVPPEEITRTKVVTTIVGGKVVYEAR